MAGKVSKGIEYPGGHRRGFEMGQSILAHALL